MLATHVRVNPAVPLVAALTLCLILAPALSWAAPQPVRKADDCNSSIAISGVPMPSTMVDAMFPLNLVVTNRVSTDSLNNQVAQSFKQVQFWPACASTLPCAGSTGWLEFVPGSESIACDAANTATVTATETTDMSGETVILFDFAMGGGPDPDALLLPAVLDTSCTITIDVQVAPMVNGDIEMQAATAGICDPTSLDPLGSTADATAMILVVPTLGETGLLLLGLLLLASTWWVLRRRASGGAAAS